MQRHICVKLLSKIPRNAPSGYAKSISPEPFFSSSFWTTNANPFCQQSFSQRSHLWKRNLHGRNGVLGRIQNGFSSRPVLARGFFSNALLKRLNKSPLNGTVRTHATRKFHSFDSQYRGWRSILRRFNTDGVLMGLIATNVAVFMLWRVASPQFMVNNFMISIDNFKCGRLHTLITSGFSHGDIRHLISDMVGLYFFGFSIGRTFGPEYLLKLYLSGALVGSIFYLACRGLVAPKFQRKRRPGTDPSKIPGLGATGAVNAIVLLDIFLFPSKIIYLEFIIPVPAILVGIFFVGTDIWRTLQGGGQVSGSAHLGGAAVAALAWAQCRRGRFPRV